MKAVVVEKYGGPEVLTVREVNKPKPKTGQVLIKFHAAGINPVDTYLRSGTQGYSPKLPWTPGLDGAGIIEAVGDGVKGMEAGTPVYTAGSLTGTYAEYGLCSPGQVFLLPGNLNWQEGASLGVPYFTAARALFTRGNIAHGKSVLVHGASGGVGSAALQLAAEYNLTLMGTAGSETGRQLVESLGAACFDHRDKDYIASIRKHCGGGVDLIIEMLADKNLDNDLDLLAADGLVIVVGSRGRIEIAPRKLMNAESSITAMTVRNSTPEERLYYSSFISRGAETGRIKPPINKVFSLETAAEAHIQIMKGPHAGNLVIDLMNSNT